MPDYERVKIDEWINGTIENVEYEDAHQFKGAHAKVSPAVRFVLVLDGYKYPHRSNWMTFMYGEKSNLFSKYVIHLVQNAKPYMNFPTEALHGMKIKTMWEENKDAKTGKVFQHLDKLKPLEAPLPWLDTYAPQEATGPGDSAEVSENPSDDEVPF